MRGTATSKTHGKAKNSRLRGESMKVKEFFRTILCTGSSKGLFNGIFGALIVFFAIAIAVPAGFAQSTGGRIRGTVTDATGGAVTESATAPDRTSKTTAQEQG